MPHVPTTSPPTTVKMNSSIKRAVKDCIEAAIEYERLVGRKLGITGEIGEMMVCNHPKLKALKLALAADPIAAGYDAVDKDGKTYQIKAKRGNLTNGAVVGKFSKYKFDFGIFIFFDKNYKAVELWSATYNTLLPAIQKNQHPVLRLGQIRKICNRIL